MRSPEQSELGRLLSRCPRRRLDVGAVRDAGSFAEASLLIVDAGIVAIAAGGGPKRRTVLSFCSPGTLLPALRGDEYLVALVDSAVIAVPAELERALLHVPAAAEAIVDALLEELRERQQSLAHFGNVAHTERLRAKLLQLARTHGIVVSGGIEVELPLTHELLGQAIGSARETVTAAVRALEQEGFLTRVDRRYRLRIAADALASDPGRRSERERNP